MRGVCDFCNRQKEPYLFYCFPHWKRGIGFRCLCKECYDRYVEGRVVGGRKVESIKDIHEDIICFKVKRR